MSKKQLGLEDLDQISGGFQEIEGGVQYNPIWTEALISSSDSAEAIILNLIKNLKVTKDQIIDDSFAYAVEYIKPCIPATGTHNVSFSYNLYTSTAYKNKYGINISYELV